MSIYGDYSFTATSTSATVAVSARLLPLDPQGQFNVDTSIDGFFASDSPNSTARITEYSASSFLFTFENFPPEEVPIPGSTATASISTLPVTLPAAASDFPLSSLHFQASASTPVTIPPDGLFFYLGQTTTIQFDSLTVGETIHVELPDNSSLTPASATIPEPHSLVLLAIGVAATLIATRGRLGGAWRRK